MKLFIAALATETNTFSPIPTGRLSFGDGLVTREATRLPAKLFTASTRTQSFARTSFTDLGFDIASMKALIVKSMNHFYAAFLPVASQVLHVCGPGTATPDMSIIPLTKRDHDYWPRVEIPAMRATSGCD